MHQIDQIKCKFDNMNLKVRNGEKNTTNKSLFLLLGMNFKNVNMDHDPRQNNAGKQKSLIKFSLS